MLNIKRNTKPSFIWSIILLWVVLILNNLALVYFSPSEESWWRRFQDETTEKLRDEWVLPELAEWVADFPAIEAGRQTLLEPGIYGVLDEKLAYINLETGEVDTIAVIEPNEKPLELIVHPYGRFIILWTEGSAQRPRLQIFDRQSDDWVWFARDGEESQWAEIETAFEKKYYKSGKYFALNDRYYISQFDQFVSREAEYIMSYFNVFDVEDGGFRAYGAAFSRYNIHEISDISEDREKISFTAGGDYEDNPLRPDRNTFVREYVVDTATGQISGNPAIDFDAAYIDSITVGPGGKLLIYDRDCFCKDDEFRIWLYKNDYQTLLFEREDTLPLTCDNETFFDKYNVVVIKLIDRIITDEFDELKGAINLLWFDYSGVDHGVIFTTNLPEVFDFSYLAAPDAGVLCYPTGVEKMLLENGEIVEYIKLRFFDVKNRTSAGNMQIPLELKHPDLYLNEGDAFPRAGETVRTQSP